MSTLARFSTGLIALAAFVLSATAAHAATSLVNIRYSPDVTVALSGATLDDEDVAIDNFAGVVTPLVISGVPPSTAIGGFHFTSATSQLLSFDTTVALTGLPAPGIATPADVVSYTTSSATFSYAFRGSLAGIPDGVAIDGIAIDEAGKLLLSFDSSVDLPPGGGALVAADEDVVRWNSGTSFAIAFDGSARGVSASLDVDGVAYLAATQHFLVSFDTSGSVGGVSFDDEDALEYAPETDTWSLAYDGNAAGTGHAEWGAADLVALDVVVDADGDGVDDATDNCPSVANPNQADGDLDAKGDLCDNCPTIANATQADGAGGLEVPSDGVGDACDNCLRVSNPRVASSFLTTYPWATLTGGQRDDDHDGYGNKCDAKFTGLPSQTVGSLDLGQFRTSSGEDRRFDTCGTAGGTRPCAIYDLDEAVTGDVIGSLDLGRFRQLSGSTPGPRCAACTGAGSVPLPCTAGTAGTCGPVP